MKKSFNSLIHNSFKLFFVFLLSPLFAQEYEIPKDTSYTVQGTFEKVVKKYPDIEIVRPMPNLNIVEYSDLEYARYNKRSLHLDLYSPKENQNKKLPLVVLIHGGGWASGDKSLMKPLAQQLAVNNFISAAIEYRLSPEARYPAAVKDIKSSIKWLKANSDTYGIDTNKIALLGTSAGGHLAALVANICTIEKHEPDDGYKNISSVVHAVVDIDGVLDFTHPAESGKDTNDTKPSAGKRWLGYSYKDNPQLWREVSPVNYVTRKSPPILFINSSIPRFHAGRDKMIDQMNKLNIYSEVHTLENSPHSFWLFNPWFEPTKQYVINFFNNIFN